MANPSRTPASRRIAQITFRILTSEERTRAVSALKLSPTQAAITALVVDGNKDRQIASVLKMSFWTVRTHLTRIFARVGVADRLELALRAFSLARAAHPVPLRRD